MKWTRKASGGIGMDMGIGVRVKQSAKAFQTVSRKLGIQRRRQRAWKVLTETARSDILSNCLYAQVEKRRSNG